MDKIIQPIEFDSETRKRLENKFKSLFPHLTLEYSPAFGHYYISDTKTKEKSKNISTYELYDRLFNKK